MQYKGLITIKRIGVQDMLVIPVEIVEVDDAMYNKLLSKDNAQVQEVKLRLEFSKDTDGHLRGFLTPISSS